MHRRHRRLCRASRRWATNESDHSAVAAAAAAAVVVVVAVCGERRRLALAAWVQ